ncbi:uncharacterized protein LOC135116070 [Scylla paramamosain]|uniref:uncharacterized protein LOC135116070 n=1 Tax=Scylla paramamosain TaxID=85552 RepID=UPI003083161C
MDRVEDPPGVFPFSPLAASLSREVSRGVSLRYCSAGSSLVGDAVTFKSVFVTADRGFFIVQPVVPHHDPPPPLPSPPLPVATITTSAPFPSASFAPSKPDTWIERPISKGDISHPPTPDTTLTKHAVKVEIRLPLHSPPPLPLPRHSHSLHEAASSPLRRSFISPLPPPRARVPYTLRALDMPSLCPPITPYHPPIAP